jgi:hypothetical protein
MSDLGDVNPENVAREWRAVLRHRTRRAATVVLPLDVIHVVEELQRARNRGCTEALVRLKDWKVCIDG